MSDLKREADANAARAVELASTYLLRAYNLACASGEWRGFEKWCGALFAEALGDQVEEQRVLEERDHPGRPNRSYDRPFR